MLLIFRLFFRSARSCVCPVLAVALLGSSLLNAESEYPATRLGIEGFVANGSLTLTLADAAEGGTTLGSNSWTNNAAFDEREEDAGRPSP